MELLTIICNCGVTHSRADNARSLNDIESTLPSEVAAKESAVDEAILERAGKFLSTHTVELSYPEESARSMEEGKFYFYSCIFFIFFTLKVNFS